MAKAGVIPDCKDCYIEYDGADDGPGFAVIFCELHLSAPELLKALQQIANGFKAVRPTEGGGWVPHWSKEDAIRFDEIARKAIAKTKDPSGAGAKKAQTTIEHVGKALQAILEIDNADAFTAFMIARNLARHALETAQTAGVIT